MVDTISVLKHYYSRLGSEDKRELMSHLGINSRATIGKYLLCPDLLTIQQGISVQRFIQNKFGLSFRLEDLSANIDDVIKHQHNSQFSVKDDTAH